MPYVKLDSGIEMFTREAGPEDGRTVFLIHGLAGLSIQWTAQIKALSDAGYRVIAADWPGHGGSTKHIDNFDFDTVVDSFAELLKKSGAAPGNEFALAGHSAGGPIANLLFSRHPDSVRALVLLQTGYSFFKLIPLAVKDLIVNSFIDIVCEPGFNRTLNTAIRNAGRLASVFLGSGHPSAIMAEVGAFDCAAEVARAEYRDLIEMDMEALLSDINAPTCIVASRFDPIVPLAHSKKMHERITGSELHIINTVGHNAHTNNASKINAIILDFLDREFPA